MAIFELNRGNEKNSAAVESTEPTIQKIIPVARAYLPITSLRNSEARTTRTTHTAMRL